MKVRAHATADTPLDYTKIQVNLKVKHNMKIGELSQRAGLAASAIRYYEEQGLLAPAGRGQNGYREYTDSALERLQAVRGAQALGFTLETIRGFFGGDGVCHKTHTLAQIALRMREVEQEQAALDAQREQLFALQAMLQRSVSSGQPMTCFALGVQ